MGNSRKAIESFGRMADDFVLNIILLKKRDCVNASLPFHYAHALELACKAAAIELGVDPEPNHHRIRDLLAGLSEEILDLARFLPSDLAYSNYRELWLNDEGVDSSELSSIPAPDVLEEWELCFVIDNVVDLKYGLRKDKSLVTVLSVSSRNLNQRFKNIFRILRSQYSDSKEPIDRGIEIFGATGNNKSVLDDIFWRRHA